MPRKTVSINKTNQAKIDKWHKDFILTHISNPDEFYDQFLDLIKEELKSHKDCTEKMVIQSYIDAITAHITSLESSYLVVWTEDMFKPCIKGARHALAKRYASGVNFTNNIDIYFNDVKREYIYHPMNECNSLEFLPENRDIFIKNSLKLVINCAKRYRGLGLPFEDLIQTGNYGLLVAFEKFDKDRANLRTAIKKAVDESGLESFTYDQAVSIVTSAFNYDKDLARTIKAIPDNGFETVKDFHDWIMKNVKTAVFASVAFQWIRAYILMELTHLSTTVKVPKTTKKELSEDEIIAGITEEGAGPAVISLDQVNPHTNDNYSDNKIAAAANERFLAEDSMIDSQDNEALFQNVISKAIAGLNDMSRRIIKKRFGIGYPVPLNIADIAESEGLLQNRVKYIISNCLKEMREHISADDREVLIEIFGSVAD